MTRGQGGWPAFPRMTFSVTPPCQINLAHPQSLQKFRGWSTRAGHKRRHAAIRAGGGAYMDLSRL